MSKKIVIFADGTGNSFTKQESNIWRLYQAIDKSQPDQIARYIRGVGTSGFRPFALLDGATGIGVPSNVRKLYRFICWTWQPGDEIWLFGFSRGAFTVRTLAGMIYHEGLVPSNVTQAEMDRNAMSAWRSYREKTTKGAVWPTIWITRRLRDFVVNLYRRARGQDRYDKIAAATQSAGRTNVPIRFLGVFDTVEAFGVPIEELRAAIDKVIWPISFRTRDLRGKVGDARHALSLDDERTSFHPIRFNPPTGQGPNIKEVWFAGVHSDVGGGYPDGALSYVPLTWMADEAATCGLRFDRFARARFRKAASPFGPLHDSRSGLAAAYRYDPRRIDPGAATDTAPVIHASVIEKMTFGSENYAPVSLPDTALVRMPNGSIKSFGPPQRLLHGAAVTQLMPPPPNAALPQFRTPIPVLPVPTAATIEQVWDLVWWRRTAYFALLVAALATVALPWTASALTATSRWIIVGAASLFHAPTAGEAFWQRLTGTNSGIASALETVSGTVGGLIPSYLGAWLTVLVEHFLGSMLVIGITAALYRWNSHLRDMIAERAVEAWSGNHLQAPPQTRSLAFARAMRNSRAAGWVYKGITRTSPYLALSCLLLIGLAGLSHAVMDYRSGNGHVCQAPSNRVAVPVPESGVAATTDFEAKDLCWNSGIKLEKGRSYTIWVDTLEPFKDDTITSGLTGFETSRPAFVAAKGIRRRWDAAWFQLLARVGSVGGTEWVVASSDGTAPVDIDADVEFGPACDAEMNGLTSTGGRSATDCSALDQEQREELRRKIIADRLPQHFVSTFVAPASGELFLYVNDAVYAAPFLPIVTAYYANNHGKARVYVRRTANPAER